MRETLLNHQNISGNVVSFGDGLLKAECTAILEQGGRVFKFTYDGIFHEILDKLGSMPFPTSVPETLDDKERYQTVFAKERGSAAPTARLTLQMNYWNK